MAAGAERVELDSPQRLAGPMGNYYAALSRDGAWLAAVSGDQRVDVFRIDHPDQRVVLDGHPGVSWLSISPDGRWVATCTQHGSGIKIWDARAGTVAADLPAGNYSYAVFSPDGRTLATSSDGHAVELWDVPTWRARVLTNHRGAALAISPDSAILVIWNQKVLKLLDTSDGAELATLESPNPLPVASVSFTPDMSRLAVACYNFHTIQLWDLRLIRRRLAEMGLDTNGTLFEATLPRS
jgi:hypothetical protein